ncbi:MAG TPA: 50S ribosomal protein L32 [Candidatus Gracilibacteria bacterium]
MSKKPVPKKQQDKSSSRSRKSKWAALQRAKLENLLVLDKCPTTGETKRRHFASESGFYNGRQVFENKKAKKAGGSLQQIEA